MSGVTVTLVSPGTFPSGAISNAGNDSIVGGSAADTIDGGVGNDSAYGSGGNDSLVGGDGNDWLIYAGPNDSLWDRGDNGAWRVTVDLGAGTTSSATSSIYPPHHNDLVSGFENVDLKML